MLNYTLPLLLLTALAACNTPQHTPEAASEAMPPDSADIAIQAVVEKTYAGFSVENGKLPDFIQLKSYFMPEARLGFVKNDTLILRPIDEYLAGMKAGLEAGNITRLKEWEIKGRTEHFGDIAHRISTYGVYVNTTDSLAERGIISYQLVKTNGEWRVLSMIWDSETPTLQLPAKYDK